MNRFICTFSFLFALTNTAFGGTIIINTGVWGDAGNTAAYSIDTGVLSDNILPHDQDAFLRTDGSDLYIIEAGQAAIIKCSPSGFSVDSVIYHYSVGEKTYPCDMIFTGSKAYVLLNVSNSILIIDPDAENDTSFKTGEIDISKWTDGDGSPDAIMGFLYNDMVYVILQRLEKDWPLSTYGESVIIMIDPATDEIVDLDPAAEGIQGVPLLLKNPQQGSLWGNTLYLACTTYGDESGGVMSIDLDDPAGSQRILFFEDALNGDTILGVTVVTNDFGLVSTMNENWYSGIPRIFNPQDGTLGDELPVPDSGGGIVAEGGKLYIGVSDFTDPGLYIVDMNTMTVESKHSTALQPYSMIFFDDEFETVVTEPEQKPASFTVMPAFPNPFNSSTTVSYSLAESSHITVDVYNTAGQRVNSLMYSNMNPGVHSVIWNTSNRATGVYYIRISNGFTSEFLKTMLIK